MRQKNHSLIMKKYKVNCKSSIKDSLSLITKSGAKCLVVVDDDDKFVGTLSDGDIRNAILQGNNIDDSIDNVFNKNSRYLKFKKYSIEEAKEMFLKFKFDLIPVIDESNKLVDILFWEKILGNSYKASGSNLTAPVVIMAGGKGTRLQPFTKVLPKPLVPVNDRPVIEHIIQRFTDYGITDIYITVNYKSRILKAYFEEQQPSYSLTFIDEEEPLGTAGSLRLLKNQINSPFFVTNCDTIIDVDLSSLYSFHIKNNFDLTLVASAKEYIIPYGTCDIDSSGHLIQINEKPKYDFLINTGLYLLNSEIPDLIPKNVLYDFPSLISNLKSKGKKIGVFPVDDGAWLDIGQWVEYQKAIDVL